MSQCTLMVQQCAKISLRTSKYFILETELDRENIYSICLFWWSRDGDPIPGHEKLPEMSKVQLLNRSRELFQSYSLWEIFRPDHVSIRKSKNCQSLLRFSKRALEFNSYREVDNYFQLLHEAQLQQENCRFLPEGSIVFH